tara:strand:- start:2 stop:334 length:333 start_codon:yes stop_codon:yes gene_type:complete
MKTPQPDHASQKQTAILQTLIRKKNGHLIHRRKVGRGRETGLSFYPLNEDSLELTSRNLAHFPHGQSMHGRCSGLAEPFMPFESNRITQKQSLRSNTATCRNGSDVQKRQ